MVRELTMGRFGVARDDRHSVEDLRLAMRPVYARACDKRAARRAKELRRRAECSGSVFLPGEL